MKGLAVAGTVAMFLVGGGILVHGFTPLHHAIEALVPAGGTLALLATTGIDGLVGVVAGALVLGAMSLGRRLLNRAPA